MFEVMILNVENTSCLHMPCPLLPCLVDVFKNLPLRCDFEIFEAEVMFPYNRNLCHICWPLECKMCSAVHAYALNTKYQTQFWILSIQQGQNLNSSVNIFFD